jgi:hypothetical protein
MAGFNRLDKFLIPAGNQSPHVRQHLDRQCRAMMLAQAVPATCCVHTIVRHLDREEAQIALRRQHHEKRPIPGLTCASHASIFLR